MVPNIVQELRRFQETRPGSVIQFLKTLAGRQELIEHYKNRHEEASQRKSQLEKVLNHMRKECEKAQSQRNEILTKLRADKFEVTDNQGKRMEDLRIRYEIRMKEHQDAFAQKKADMEKK